MMQTGTPSDASAPRIRVLLCDDHDGVRGALRLLLSAEPDLEVVGEATDGQTLLRLAAEQAADVILLDISLPDMSGFAVASALRHAGCAAKVVALSAHEDQGYVERMRAAGASGYVVKRKVGCTLVPIIRDVARAASEPLVTPPPVSPSEAAAGAPQLSGPEVQLLKLLADGQTRTQIAAALGLSLVEAEAQQHQAMDKLGLRSRAEVVRYARRCGWLGEQS